MAQPDKKDIKIFVSACLMGEKVRYDGQGKQVTDDIWARWVAQGRIVSLCPELSGGLSVPRRPAEIIGGDGTAVWNETAEVEDNAGQSVTSFFQTGATLALQLIQKHKIQMAVLKEDSPSCGVTHIYDGCFSGRKIEGQGVTAALLTENGVRVFSEHQLPEADAYLRDILSRS